MKLAITGGYGYIGSQILDNLTKDERFEDWNIFVIDNGSYGRGTTALDEIFKSRIKNFSSHILDISNTNGDSSNKLKSILLNADYVINLASLTQIPNTSLHESYIYDGVKNILDILSLNNRIKKIIDISSASIYGSLKHSYPEITEPFDENVYPSPDTALHQYSEFKLQTEKLWELDKYKNLPFTSLRLSTCFGYAVGLRHNLFINEFLFNAFQGKKTIVPGKQENSRPFVHVHDAANVILHLLEYDPDTNGHILNIGSNDLNPRLGDLFKQIQVQLKKEYGLDASYEFAFEKDKDTIQESYILDYSKFNEIVEYELKFTFENGVEHFMKKLK